ncbi:hypothetical protein BDE36_2411 [Arcticibacter tournemirensis]|uniref:Uncharacterized protein n=1 Tax=Arcticibacter tournemirensis TaxID=699437 RepID=A0A5M9H197_9SPHI|nr:hypothetical protein [Arcticibacter tournemirensis]KAA8480059.1 hypothetical protein F1649_15655 [Arcticibacter tournemirensis]TQM50659.1 hypothetical protein BDE36_2411 [Arcticibacter tournemirensis]
MEFKINIDEVELEIISKRLKNLVSPVTILKWLSNFEEDEVYLAVRLIRNLKMYTSFEIEEAYHAGLTAVLKKLMEGSKLAVHPIGKFGKSGSMMAYLLRKTQAYTVNQANIQLASSVESLKSLPQEFDTLLLLDDFLGTGKSVETYYNSEILPIKQQFKQIFFLGVAAMEDAVRTVGPLFDYIFIEKSQIYRKAFSSFSSYFGYRKHGPYKKLSYRYGMKLTRPEILQGGGLKYHHALGFENSQSLVTFFYGSPNNTLPIFWQQDKKLPFHPLVPRLSPHKISQAREFRKQLSYELSLLQEFGTDMLKTTFATARVIKGKKIFSSVSHIDFSIYAILKLKRDGFNEFSICQRLGITGDDYLAYMNKGKSQGIFDRHHDLTLRGLSLFQQAKKCISQLKKIALDKKTDFEIKKNAYFPKSFNGRR